MFANTQSFSLNFAFPDVCKTLIALITTLIPYPNFSFTSTAIPNVFNQYIMCMPIHNLMTVVPTSTGNELGTLLGVVSQLIKGSTMHFFGSIKIFRCVLPATKMFSMSGHNGSAMNIIGGTFLPCQLKVVYGS